MAYVLPLIVCLQLLLVSPSRLVLPSSASFLHPSLLFPLLLIFDDYHQYHLGLVHVITTALIFRLAIPGTPPNACSSWTDIDMKNRKLSYPLSH